MSRFQHCSNSPQKRSKRRLCSISIRLGKNYVPWNHRFRPRQNKLNLTSCCRRWKGFIQSAVPVPLGPDLPNEGHTQLSSIPEYFLQEQKFNSVALTETSLPPQLQASRPRGGVMDCPVLQLWKAFGVPAGRKAFYKYISFLTLGIKTRLI